MSPTTPAPPASTTEPALTPYSTVHIPPITSPTSAHRLGMRPSTRAALAGASGLAIGGILGASKGGLAARLRFRAENAHRLPRTTRGWYFYHKSKNYHVLLAGIKEAARMGGRIGFWGAVLFTLEAQVDRARAGRKDFLSTTIAGGTVAGLFSAFSTWTGIVDMTEPPSPYLTKTDFYVKTGCLWMQRPRSQGSASEAAWFSACCKMLCGWQVARD